MDQQAKRIWRTAALDFGIWTILGLYYCSQAVLQKFLTNEPTPWWHYLLSWLVGVYLWALLTPIVLWLARRFPFTRKVWPRRLLLHFLLSVVITIIQLALESSILHRLGVFPSFMKGFVPTFAFLLTVGFHQGIITYFTLLAIQYGIDYYQRYQERKREALRLELHTSELKNQLVNAQLSALKMQLQPHFLFNTLNAIMVLVRQQRGKQAEEMLARLSDLLRCVLEDVDAQEVPLRRELEYLRLYLSIEEVRFQDRLRVTIAADPQVLNAAVPHMVLQPIVENAVRHGVGRSALAGKIEVRTSRIGETLQLTVSDDGPGLPAAWQSQGTGIGLANTRARLHQLYGETARLMLENAPVGGAVVTMVLPYHLAPGMEEPEVVEIDAPQHLDR